MLKREAAAWCWQLAGPAAFRRLCVETFRGLPGRNLGFQPPSGGCVLKQYKTKFYFHNGCQPPSGGCVLKPPGSVLIVDEASQPPSGGCVLKLVWVCPRNLREWPAAFRRLCVETGEVLNVLLSALPAAFRRLCVETTLYRSKVLRIKPAAFRRLCVETVKNKQS